MDEQMYEQMQRLMDLFADQCWPFDKRHYPGIEALSEEERKQFAILHVLMHQAKALGQAFGAMEPCDHGAPTHDDKNLRGAAVKFFNNAVRLAKILDISSQELWKKALYFPP